MVVYFSGTGNSEFCARRIAEALADELLDSAGYIRHGIAADLITGKPWVFVAPTYAWQIPVIFADFIRSGSFSGSTDAYFVMTCGSDTGNAAEFLRELCEEKGLTFRGLMPIVMPENYIAMFDAPGPEKAAEIVRAALPVLEQAVRLVLQGENFPVQTVRMLDQLKSGPINKGFNRYYVRSNKFYATDACVGCGRCVEVCVLNNISLDTNRPVWSDRCTHCMACICGCPEEAIEYGKKSLGRPRYRVPQI
jgi:ferredoxin/flavodoxin